MGNTIRSRVAQHRARLRAQGMRPLQIWVPDTTAPGFDEECHRQSVALAASEHAEDDQTFVDAVAELSESLEPAADQGHT